MIGDLRRSIAALRGGAFLKGTIPHGPFGHACSECGCQGLVLTTQRVA